MRVLRGQRSELKRSTKQLAGVLAGQGIMCALLDIHIFQDWRVFHVYSSVDKKLYSLPVDNARDLDPAV